MKRNSIVTALIMGTFLVAGASPALAEWYDPASLDSQQSYQREGSDPGQYEFSAPVETGSLPMGEDLSAAKSGAMDEFESHENGAITFRNGIDDGP